MQLQHGQANALRGQRLRLGACKPAALRLSCRTAPPPHAAANRRQHPAAPRAIAPATEEQLPGESAALQPRPKLANSVTELIGV